MKIDNQNLEAARAYYTSKILTAEQMRDAVVDNNQARIRWDRSVSAASECPHKKVLPGPAPQVVDCSSCPSLVSSGSVAATAAGCFHHA